MDEMTDCGGAEPAGGRARGMDPEQEAVLADSVGLALLVVLDTLSPAERLAFVLHDMFDLPFEDIAPIVGCSTAAARQLASRARRRVQGRPAIPAADLARQRAVVDAFLAASRASDFEALLEVLEPEVVLRADRVALPAKATRQFRGAPAVARQALLIRAVPGSRSRHWSTAPWEWSWPHVADCSWRLVSDSCAGRSPGST